MAWTASDGALFTKPLMRQLLAIINRDIQAALDYVSGVPGSYPPFIEYHIANKPIKQPPVILLWPQAVKFEGETQRLRHQHIGLLCTVAVAHQTPTAVAEMLEDYLRAVNEVLTAAWRLTSADFYSNSIPMPTAPTLGLPAGTLAPGLTFGSLKEVWVEEMAYDELRVFSKALFAKAATMLIHCELFEG